MAASHEIIPVAGVLCLLAIFARLLSARVGTPLLLVFIGVGMLAGEDGPGGSRFDDFQAAYLVGSLALAAILFQGGLSTERSMIRQALWPSVALATAGVAISAVVAGGAAARGGNGAHRRGRGLRPPSAVPRPCSASWSRRISCRR